MPGTRAWHVIRRAREAGTMNIVQKIVKATKQGVHKTAKTAHKAVAATKKAIRRYR